MCCAMRISAPLGLALSIAGWATAPAAAAGQAKTPELQAADKEIRQATRAFIQAFNRGDAKSVASSWTPDGEYIAEDGKVFSGRAAIEKEYAALFKAHPKAQVRVAVESIRFLGPMLAFEEGTTHLMEPPIGTTSNARFTALYIKQDGKWLLASVRDQESTLLTKYQDLKVLETLIGDWTATSGETRVEMTCEWLENRNFIRRRYQRYQGEDPVGSGFEIIGIDPEIGEISSWQFTGDGGLGHNIWRWDGKRWVIEAKGTTADGKPTSATNILVPVSKDSFSWHSVDRSMDGEPLADTPTARIVRKKGTTGGP